MVFTGLQFSYSLLVTLELHEESIRKGALTLDIISVYTRLIPADVEELRRESKSIVHI